MILALLGTTPWVALVLFMALRVRLPRELPDRRTGAAPLVSVIVPARNERVNIEACLTSLTASRYPAFEIVVVDDRSDDGTGDLSRAVPAGHAQRVEVVSGTDLPPGWLGKPWACQQGARAARGDLLLFTDADTTHGADLLDRAVEALREDRADVVTVAGRQLMGSFWERVVQPQIFFAMVLRFFDVEARIARGRWREAIANGQFLLFRREGYEALGGHEAVRGEVVEDLALAQLVVRRGFRLSLRRAESAFATRMYRSLGELVAGWSKNLAIGALRTVPGPLRPFVLPASALGGIALWLLPPVALAGALAGVGEPPLLLWSACVVGLSALFWMTLTARMGAPVGYGLLYPLGACVGLWILVRSWSRGSRVSWKGRDYVVVDPPEGS